MFIVIFNINIMQSLRFTTTIDEVRRGGNPVVSEVESADDYVQVAELLVEHNLVLLLDLLPLGEIV